MPINTRKSYFEIGTSVNLDYSLNNVLELPVPHQLPFSSEFLADANRNAVGTMILSEIGRTQYTTQISWEFLKNTKWWEINRWFETYGYAFYCKYFNHSDGRVKIQRFYRGNQEKATPSTNTEIMNGYAVPKKYLNCGFSVIDMGEDDVIIVDEMSVM